MEGEPGTSYSDSSGVDTAVCEAMSIETNETACRGDIMRLAEAESSYSLRKKEV
jgi:hypothetical protein